jgi:hypothetical protein
MLDAIGTYVLLSIVIGLGLMATVNVLFLPLLSFAQRPTRTLGKANPGRRLRA